MELDKGLRESVGNIVNGQGVRRGHGDRLDVDLFPDGHDAGLIAFAWRRTCAQFQLGLDDEVVPAVIGHVEPDLACAVLDLRFVAGQSIVGADLLPIRSAVTAAGVVFSVAVVGGPVTIIVNTIVVVRIEDFLCGVVDINPFVGRVVWVFCLPYDPGIGRQNRIGRDHLDGEVHVLLVLAPQIARRIGRIISGVAVDAPDIVGAGVAGLVSTVGSVESLGFSDFSN